VNQVLLSWLDELREDGLQLSAETGSGANENLWCVSLPSPNQFDVDELVAFLRSAVVIRRELAISQAFRPVTFYAWHDEMAGQLRFSTARCASSALPFGAKVRLVPEPRSIVVEAFQSPYRDGIPWEELHEVPFEETTAPALSGVSCLDVWAVELV
jgi:hypothetical protein